MVLSLLFSPSVSNFCFGVIGAIWNEYEISYFELPSGLHDAADETSNNLDLK